MTHSVTVIINFIPVSEQIVSVNTSNDSLIKKVTSHDLLVTAERVNKILTD